MRDEQGRAVSNGNLLASSIRLMQQQIVKVCSEMMCCSTIQNPVVRIVLLSSYKIGSRWPSTRLRRVVAHRRVELGVSFLELGASMRTVTMHTTELASALIAASGLVGARETFVALLPRLLIVVVVMAVPLVSVAIVALTRGRVVCHSICSNRYDRRALALKLDFIIEELLVEFSNSWRRVTAADLINKLFVFLG